MVIELTMKILGFSFRRFTHGWKFRNFVKVFIILLIMIAVFGQFISQSPQTTDIEMVEADRSKLTLLAATLHKVPKIGIAEPKSPEAKNSEQYYETKWIVVTSVNYPTDQIRKLSQIPGWTLLVVADKKTPSNWTYPNVKILKSEDQRNLGYKITEYLPWNSYTRKVIGYLYAIQHGAQVIYDTDDDNAPDDSLAFEKGFSVTEPTIRGLVLRDEATTISGISNPYVHFGQPSVWPRGYPLESIGLPSNNTYRACQMQVPLIQQGLVNGDPDVDAIFRLTRKSVKTPLNIQFDGSAPPLLYPKSVLAPFNSQNTVFHYDAFWALLLPVSVTFRVTDIWRGYWAQPLLWSIGAHLGFYSPHTTQIRNPHFYLRDFGEEDKLYKQVGALVQFLRKWKCEHKDLYNCMIELTSAMAELNFWSRDEIQLVKAWISDLKLIGYKVPPMMDRSDPKSPCLPGKLESFAIFNGAMPKTSRKNQEDYRIELRTFCNLPLPKDRLSLHPFQFPSTLLIVTFNHPHYENIWFLDKIYRPHYPNILYCGDLVNLGVLHKLDSKEHFIRAQVSTNSYSFIVTNSSDGFFGYECAMRAIDMGYGGLIKGYLILSDDILLSFWRNEHLNLDIPWWRPEGFYVRDLNNLPSNPWPWWNTPFGLNATKSALAKIYSPEANQILQKFATNRKKYWGFNETIAGYAISDIYYFPVAQQDEVYEVASVLREFEVILEVSIPIIMSGLGHLMKIVRLIGNSHAGNSEATLDMLSRGFPQNYVHPVKLSDVNRSANLRQIYCEHFIKEVLTFSNRKMNHNKSTKSLVRWNFFKDSYAHPAF